jgi:hypothetical protein
MKKTLSIAALLTISLPALANPPAPPSHPTGSKGTPSQMQQEQQQQGQNTTVNSGSESAATNAGNTQQIVFTSPGESTSKVEYSGTQTVRNVPSVSGPPLVSSNDTCMGSISGAVNVPGVGVGFGKTTVDENCVMLKNSREMWNMGMKGAALARMCMDSLNKEALEITGFTCPQTTRDQQKAAQAASAPKEQYTDPIVRERLGLAPLK